MSRNPANTVVEGEASESDSEEDVAMKSSLCEQKAKRLSGLGVVVSGEASESDEEEDRDESISSITPLRVDPDKQGDNALLITTPTTISPRREHAPKYDTLLHKKLYEKNIALHNHIQGLVAQEYTSCAKDLHNIVIQMAKSQAAVQDMSHNMQLLTNDLFHLEDKVDIIATCQILPVINISVPSKAGNSSSSSSNTPSPCTSPSP